METYSTYGGYHCVLEKGDVGKLSGSQLGCDLRSLADGEKIGKRFVFGVSDEIDARPLVLKHVPDGDWEQVKEILATINREQYRLIASRGDTRLFSPLGEIWFREER